MKKHIIAALILSMALCLPVRAIDYSSADVIKKKGPGSLRRAWAVQKGGYEYMKKASRLA